MKTYKKKNRRTRRLKRRTRRKTRKMKGGMNNPVIPVIPINPLQGATPLMYAAMNGDIVEVKRLIAEGVDLNSTNAHGDTAMILSILYNHPYVVPVLLTGDCNLDVKGAYGGTALMHAVLKRDADTVELLAVAGADLNLQDDRGDSALLIGVKLPGRQGRFVVKVLTAKADINLNLEDANGDTALIVASSPPFTMDTVLYLLLAGADIRPKDNIAKTNIITWIKANTNGEAGALQQIVQHMTAALVAIEQRNAEGVVSMQLF